MRKEKFGNKNKIRSFIQQVNGKAFVLLYPQGVLSAYIRLLRRISSECLGSSRE